MKIIFTLAFVLSLSLASHRAWPAYILFFTFILSITLISRISLRVVHQRALWVVPFTLAAFPLIFTGSPPLITLSIFPYIPISYSPAGVSRFISIVLKTWISVQAAILLTATTDFHDIIFCLKQLKVPPLFIAIISLMWRYLFVIIEETTRMLRARSARSAISPGVSHSRVSFIWRAKVTGGMAGSLFLRSLERSDRVYAAMLSRGYNGEPPAFETCSIPSADRKALIFALGLLALISFVGLLV